MIVMSFFVRRGGLTLGAGRAPYLIGVEVREPDEPDSKVWRNA